MTTPGYKFTIQICAPKSDTICELINRTRELEVAGSGAVLECGANFLNRAERDEGRDKSKELWKTKDSRNVHAR